MSRGILYYVMIPGLFVAALLQSTAANRIEIGGVKPDLVLLLVLIGTLIYGVRPGVIWAFVGGLGLDIFSGGPMGSSSLALMAASLVAGLGHRTLSRFNLLVPVGVTAVGTFVYAVVYLAILAGLESLNVAHHALPLWSTVQYVVAPVLLYNMTIMVVLIPLLNRVPESQDIFNR
jgi:rod shape-determining protein MreD